MNTKYIQLSLPKFKYYNGEENNPFPKNDIRSNF